jgi:uncharacterized protein (DUF952 family)
MVFVIIVHCLKETEWKKALQKRFYGEKYLNSCGFIHCSPVELMVDVANYNFKHETGLVLLCIDTEKVRPEIVWEDLEDSGNEYPHIYGLLNIDAVIEILAFPPCDDGNFQLPEGIERYI